jgi:hypothetical protein
MWIRGKGRGQVNMKTDLTVDSVKMEVKITGIWLRAFTGCSNSILLRSSIVSSYCIMMVRTLGLFPFPDIEGKVERFTGSRKS